MRRVFFYSIDKAEMKCTILNPQVAFTMQAYSWFSVLFTVHFRSNILSRCNTCYLLFFNMCICLSLTNPIDSCLYQQNHWEIACKSKIAASMLVMHWCQNILACCRASLCFRLLVTKGPHWGPLVTSNLKQNLLHDVTYDM